MRHLFNEVDTIIFDNDGTIFHADLVSFPAVVSAYKDLIKIHKVKITIPSKDEINAHIGLPAGEYFKSLLPDHLHELLEEFQQLCVNHEVMNIKKGLGSLYPEVKEVLIELKNRNYRLGVVTNAGIDYFNAVVETFQYQKLFDAYLCLGDRTHLGKEGLVKELLDHFQSKQGAIVGDKKHDVEAGRKHKCLTIAVRYGYGSDDELKKAHEKIDNFSQLLDLFKHNIS